MSAATTDYTITAAIVCKDATGDGAAQATRHLRAVEGEAQRVSGSIGGAFARAFALIGGAAGIGYAVRGIIGLNSEMQTTQNGLATLFSATAGLPLTQSIGLARKELKALKADAAAGVGELSDYTQAYQMVLSPGLGAGKSLEEIRGLVRNALAAGSALRGQEGLRFAPMDLQQAMTAGAGERTTPIVMAALRAAGISQEKFNAKNGSERFDDLMAGFAKFGPGVELMGKSWDAQFSTLRDHVKDLIRTVSGPLFDRWSADLSRVNQWLAANKEQMAVIASEWGGKLVSMWDTLISRAGTYAAILAATQIAPMPGFGGLRKAGKTAGADFMGGFGAPGAGASLGYRLASGAEGLAGGVGLGGLGAALSAAAGPLLIVGAGLLAVTTAIKNGGPAVSAMEGALLRVKEAVGAASAALDYLTAKGAGLDSLGQALLTGFGGLAVVLDPLVRLLASTAIGFGLIFNIITDFQRSVFALLTGDLAGAAGHQASASRRFSEAGDALTKVWGTQYTGTKHNVRPSADAGTIDPKDLRVPKNVTNIGTVNIYPKVEINADPDRLTAMLGESLDKLRTFSRSGSRLPALGV